MNKFPTSYEIFGLDCLGEEASESLKMEYIFHCVDDCISKHLIHTKKFSTANHFDSKKEKWSGCLDLLDLSLVKMNLLLL